MKVITEKRLRELIFKDLNCDLIMADEAIEACAELNPWQPIESAPKDREILVFAPSYDGLRSLRQISKYHPDAGYCIDELRHPTHWQELPEDPK